MECKHFRHPADEQLRILDISSNNNLPSVLFEVVVSCMKSKDRSPENFKLQFDIKELI